MEPTATTLLSGDQIADMGLPNWRSLYEALEARFRTRDYATGRRFIDAIVDAADELNHHPDSVDLHYGHVRIRLISHDVHGKTARDVELARRIDGIALELGLSAQPSALSRVEIGLDTWDKDEIEPFWKAVLGLDRRPRFDQDLADPAGHLPALGFQQCERHAEPTQRFHLDIRVPPEVAQERIERAVAAGGTVVSTEHAPRFTVLADPQGNKVCVCTHLGRDD